MILKPATGGIRPTLEWGICHMTVYIAIVSRSWDRIPMIWYKLSSSFSSTPLQAAVIWAGPDPRTSESQGKDVMAGIPLVLTLSYQTLQYMQDSHRALGHAKATVQPVRMLCEA